jgi:hypothetical protein
MNLEFSRQIFEKCSSIKFHENLSSASRVFVSGRTDKRMDIINLVGTFCDFAKVPNSTFCPHSVFMCFVWISEQTAIISLYSINWPVFVTETECVYCAVRTESFIYN